MAADSSHSLQRGADSQSTSSAQSELNSAKKARRAAPKIPSSSDEDDAVSDPHAGEEEESWEKQEFPVLGPTSDGLFGESPERRELGGKLTTRRVDRSHAERYKLRKSWESLVERIGTADNETEDRLCFLVLW